MFVTSCLGSNDKGHLTIGGVDAVDLANKYGTPLYVMDERTIRGIAAHFNSQLTIITAGKGLAVYAIKAFNCRKCAV